MVNSPRTSAKVSSSAFRMPCRMFGEITRTITLNQLAPRLRAASESVFTSIAPSPAASAR